MEGKKSKWLIACMLALLMSNFVEQELVYGAGGTETFNSDKFIKYIPGSGERLVHLSDDLMPENSNSIWQRVIGKRNPYLFYIPDKKSSVRIDTTEKESNPKGYHYESSDRKNLSPSEIKEIEEWRSLSNKRTTVDKIGDFAGKLIAFFGIVLTVWGMMFYLAYHFDKVNFFLDLSLVYILTLGRIYTSGDEEYSTFNSGSTSKKHINHKDAIKITLMSLVFAGTILTGVLYELIYFTVDFFDRILN